MSVAPEDWPTALRVLSGCMDTDPSEETRALAAQMTPADWHNFAHLACVRHRVAPVVSLYAEALGAPPATVEEIRRETRACTIETLRQGAALKELLEKLADVDGLLQAIP